MSEQDIRDTAASAVPIGDVPPEPGKDQEFELGLAALPRNDTGNAARFIGRHGHNFLWDKATGCYSWDGKRWDLANGETRAMVAAQETAAAIAHEAVALAFVAELAKDQGPLRDEGKKQFDLRIASLFKRADEHRAFGIASGNDAKLSAMLRQAAPHLGVRQDDLDSDPFLLNVQNGTLELGPAGGDEAPTAIRLRGHDRRDRITKICPVAYDSTLGAAARPNWEATFAYFLPKTQVGVAEYLQRALGYSIAGSIEEQCIHICEGEGNNGKSTVLDAVSYVLGDYGQALPADSLMGADRGRGSEATPDLARLTAARLVRAAEPRAGAVLDDGVVKRLTSKGAIPVRHLNKGFFDLTATCKIWMECNRLPKIQTEDRGTWRRIRRIRFTVSIDLDAIDRKFVEAKLEPEGSAILNWLLDGYRAWREQGLDPPRAVVEATGKYRAESDWLGNFLRACCEVTGNPRDEISGAGLWWVYERWCERNGEDLRSRKAFGSKMGNRDGIEKQRSGTVSYAGIRYNNTGAEIASGAPV